MPKSCVIVGAGIAGLSAGRCLQDHGWTVVILDKGRTPGGRMATRQFCGAVFDHGAQFFTARNDRFQSTIDRWLESGIAREWFTQEGHTRYIGTNGMSAVAQHLAVGLDVRVSEHVEQIAPGWRVVTRTSELRADAVISTAPVEQSLELLRFDLPASIRLPLEQIRFDPCFAVMALLSSPSLIPAPGYFRPESGPIAWLADNQQKGISILPAVTIHAQADFTRRHWDAPRDDVGGMLIQAARQWLPGHVVERQVHRWKYSMLAATLPERCIKIEHPGPLVFAGDAFGGPRVEGAWLSGLAAAEALLRV